MSITLQQMKYFRELARSPEWNLTKTAKTLYISQPALSYAIAALEKELGVPLFERKGQRFILTPCGRTFLRHVEELFDRLSSAVAEVRTQQEIHTRRVTVGCVPDLVERFLHGFLRDCCGRGQDNQLELSLCYRSETELPGMLERGEADLVLCTVPQDIGVEFRPLFQTELRLCVPLGHPLSRLPCAEPKQLNAARLVRLSSKNPIQTAVDGFLSEHGIVCRTAAVQERVDDAAVFVANGTGIGFFPETAMVQRYGLQSIPLVGGFPIQTVFLARKRTSNSFGAPGKAWEQLLQYGERWSRYRTELRLHKAERKVPGEKSSA